MAPSPSNPSNLRDDEGLYLASESGAQLLIYIPFMQLVKVHSTLFKGPEEEFLFKKYLNFEKSLGEDNEIIQLVQQKAIEYVQSSLPSQDNS